MNYNFLTIYIFIFLILTTRQFHLSYYTELESKLRQLTMETLTKISSNLYMINYLNDYYLQDLLQFNNKEIADIVKFAYQKFGTEYDFNIQAFTPGFVALHLMYLTERIIIYLEEILIMTFHLHLYYGLNLKRDIKVFLLFTGDS